MRSAPTPGSRLCLYYRNRAQTDRWLPGDRFVLPALRRMVRGRWRMDGVDKVFQNLCLGLERLGVEYLVNLPFDELRPGDRVGVLGRGRKVLQGYRCGNPMVAGIGLMTHPSEWPTLCDEYPVTHYLQHSAWANEVYRPYFGDRCAIWPVGIDTETWTPGRPKEIDILIYDKIMWNREAVRPVLFSAIGRGLSRFGLASETIRCGGYSEEDYRDLVRRSKAMIFLCEHESQGIAYQECLSCGVPVLAWDQGRCLDPQRFRWGQPEIPTSSVPYFDARCGERFAGAGDFDEKFEVFVEGVKASRYRPRELVMETLTLEKSAAHFLSFFGLK